MFHTKQRKIKDYLAGLDTETMSVFDELLRDHINGIMTDKLKSEGLSGIEIHIDWHDNYKCIDIQAERKPCYFLNTQIESKEYMIGIGKDEDEVEKFERLPLVSSKEFYETVHKIVKKCDARRTP